MRRNLRHASNAVMAIVAVLLFCAGLDRAAQAAGSGSDADPRFADLEHRYVVFFLEHYPLVATYLGGAAFDFKLADVDTKLRDYSPSALAAEQAELIRFRAEFQAFDPSGLGHAYQVDEAVAMAQINFMLHEQQVRKYQQRSLDTYLDEPALAVDLQIDSMTPTGDHSFGTELEWQAVLQRTRAIPAYLKTAEQELAAGVAAGNTPDWRMLAAGLKTAQADAKYFAETVPELNAQYQASTSPARLTELKAAGKQAAEAYTQLRDYLVRTFFDDPSALGSAALKPAFRQDRYAIGEAEYDWALHNNFHLQTTAGKLYDDSWPVVQQTRNDMVSLAREIAGKHGWPLAGDGPSTVKLVFSKLSEDAPADDAEMLAGYRKVIGRLEDYGRETQLFDIPPGFRLAVEFTPEPLRDTVGNASYFPAPPFKETGVGHFYITPTGNDKAALREEDDYASMAVLAGHEGFPGHGLHYDVMRHWRDSISPVRWLTPGSVQDSSAMWEDSMAIEGWAFYCESLLAEPQSGAPGGLYTPEEHLYQLRGQLLREIRVRVDTGIHTGRLSFDDAVDLFSEDVDFLPGSCRDGEALKDSLKKASCAGAYQQVARYARWPTQAITYQLGKQQILALREHLQQELGKAFSMEVFHLTLMTEGTIPVTYVGDDVVASMEFKD